VRNGQFVMVCALTKVKNEKNVELKAVTTIERIMVCVEDMEQKSIYVR
jgi:hypothetical protein